MRAVARPSAEATSPGPCPPSKRFGFAATAISEVGVSRSLAYALTKPGLVDERTQLLDEPLEGDLLPAAPLLQLRDAAVSEVQGELTEVRGL